jgi:hypothetical protein
MDKNSILIEHGAVIDKVVGAVKGIFMAGTFLVDLILHNATAVLFTHQNRLSIAECFHYALIRFCLTL